MERISLRELVFKLVQEGKIQSEEFEALSAYYGIDKLRSLYREEMKRRRLKQEHHESQLQDNQRKWGTKDAPPGDEEWI